MSNKIFLSKNKLTFNFFPDIDVENDITNFESSIKLFLKESINVICLNSGSSAIHLALILSGVEQGDEVLCQSFTYIATINPIIYQNATPIFIDSEEDTWNMCPVQLELAIRDRISKGTKPKAIIFVHLYGMPAKIDEIIKISRKYNITLIEDAAEAFGSIYKGRKCGTFGDFGILSFNNNKIITTFGGGALICGNQKEKALFLATQAKDMAPHYQHSQVGYNYRINGIAAAVGVSQMKELNKNVVNRRKNMQFYESLFKDVVGVSVFKEPTIDYFSNHWLSCIIINEKEAGFSSEDLRLQLLEDNIESRPFWKPMHLQPVFKDYPFYGNQISENLFKNGLCLPSSSNLSKTDLERIISSIKKLL